MYHIISGQHDIILQGLADLTLAFRERDTGVIVIDWLLMSCVLEQDLEILFSVIYNGTAVAFQLTF